MLIGKLNKTRRIGCEFEMTCPLVGTGTGNDVQETLAKVLGENGITAIFRPYDNSALPHGVDVGVEYDSSICGESRFEGIKWFSIEVKTRILEGMDDWERIVPKTLEICRYLGARVNRTTGFHIHLDFPEVLEKPTNIRSLFNLLFRFEKIIFGLVAPSRSNNNYTKAIIHEQSQLLRGCKSARSFCRQLMGWDDKAGLNLTHLLLGNRFDRKPRVELRYHHGTLDPSKARHWVRFCLQMMQHAVTRNCHYSAQQILNNRVGLEKLLISCGFKVNNNIYSKVSPELREAGKFIMTRWKHFNGNIPLKAAKSSIA